ncbi:MAG TPA: hypothetical protein EYG73_00500 [Arcobacter sp.]|nr:hypothetical protein [Arcobacter sp.]
MKKTIGLGLIIGSLLVAGCSSKNYYNTNADGSEKADSCNDIRNKLFTIDTSDYPSQYSYKETQLLRVGARACDDRDNKANKDYAVINQMHNEADSLHNRADSIIKRGKDIYLGK